MSRIKSDKINIASSILVDYSKNSETEEVSCAEVLKCQAKTDEILSSANAKAQEIIERSRQEASQINEEANQIILRAQEEAQRLEQEAALKFQEAQQEIETIKQNASQEGAKEGYEAGYADGLEKIKEELIEKISQAQNLAQSGFLMRDKIVNSAKSEIVEMMCLLAKKLLLERIDKEAVFKTVERCISLLGEKDEITLVLSKNYADLLNEFVGENESEILKNVKISYAQNDESDTILVQTPKERLDGSFGAQLDVILEQFKSQLHGAVEVEEK